jgi:alpha-D-ribose 1-methylphosphonate 5-triphosphate synthase subunit PhnH
MEARVLEGGFADLPVDASHAFRALMTAMARPGEIVQVAGARPPAPMSVAAGVVVLTLCDPETPIYLAPGHDTPQIRDWITFHTGAPFAKSQGAMFALGTWAELPVSDFQIGTAAYPDRSATVIVERPTLSNEGAVLNGPGIKDHATLSLPETAIFQTNTTYFPLGLDFIFTCNDRLAALPRTTRVS